MDLSQASKSKKNSPMNLLVLNAPSKNLFKEVPSPSSQYQLYTYLQKKYTLAAYKLLIPKSKLLSNLQIYQWRCQTQFPIVKTAFVYINQNQTNSSCTVQITAFNQYCPMKLTQIYQMPTGQVLYLLKESMIGFERLYNRFGGFEILNSMIAINQKGFCRVWFNQNFALNTFPKREITQSKMVHKIITILESHSQDSKILRKLFNYLENCSTFFNAIKSIDNFVKEQKIFVPTKFLSISSSRQIPIQTPTIKKQPQIQNQIPSLITRFSIKNDKLSKFKQMIKEQVEKSKRQRKTSFSPLHIKRLKSEKVLYGVQPLNKIMKVSHQQTSHTKKINGNKDFLCSSPTSLKAKSKNQQKNVKRNGWIEQSSYTMGQQQSLSQQFGIKKKQMTQSEAFSFGNQMISTIFNNSERKYSCKLSTSPKPENRKNFNAFNKKNQSYFGQFQQLLCSNQKLSPSTKTQIQDSDEERIRTQVSGCVLKNNGWVAKVSGLLDIPTNLQQSFHEGQEQYIVTKQIKLEKLNNIGRQQMLMSILHQQFEDIL